jgi:hypothetical protein
LVLTSPNGKSREHKKPSVIDDALAEIGRIAFVEPAICTGWVLVSEWMGEGDKDYWTLTLADDQNPDWRHLGLVHHGLKNWEGNDDVGLRDKPTERLKKKELQLLNELIKRALWRLGDTRRRYNHQKSRSLNDNTLYMGSFIIEAPCR